MIDFRTYTLPNGLRVIHSYDPSMVMATVNVLYNTGARDESRSLTGIAHLFEHLMFGGSANIEAFDEELENAGGNSNAWTSNDFTNFFDNLPAANIETALHLESDRMLALSFKPETLAVQKSVVIEEFKQQCLNRPYGDLMHGLRKALYAPSHPYSWPVIGIEPGHIASVTEDDVRNWFYSHYAPNNAVLSLVGNIDYDHGKQLIEKWFGDIPSRSISSRNIPPNIFPSEPKLVEMTGAVPYPNIVIAYPMSPYGYHDYRVADCITDILSAGRSSRLVRRLIIEGDGSIIEADASVAGSEHEGFLMLSARVAHNDDELISHAAEALIREFSRMAIPGNVTPYELERTLNRFESTFLISNLDGVSRAQNLAMAEMHAENINETVDRQRLVTLPDITRVAAQILSRPPVTLIYRPKKD